MCHIFTVKSVLGRVLSTYGSMAVIALGNNVKFFSWLFEIQQVLAPNKYCCSTLFGQHMHGILIPAGAIENTLVHGTYVHGFPS